MAGLLVRVSGGQQQLLHNIQLAARRSNLFFNIWPRFNLNSYATATAPGHDYHQRLLQAKAPLQQGICPRGLSSSSPAAADNYLHAHAQSSLRPHDPLSKSKRIHIVEYCCDGRGHAAVFALRLRSPRDFQRMLATSGLLCLVPAEQDAATNSWRFSGDGTRCFSDLRENTFYMAMSALRRRSSAWSGSHSDSSPENITSLRETVNQVRKELTNRALGEEGELTEALLRIFCKEAGFANMVSKPQLRIVENEEVDAVLLSAHSCVIGFHCNKLTHKEAAAALKRVSRWAHLASTGSAAHSFLLGKDLYVGLSGNLLPNKEKQHVISYCQKHGLMLLLKNGVNFSLQNSLLPPQHNFIVPAKLHCAQYTKKPQLS